MFRVLRAAVESAESSSTTESLSICPGNGATLGRSPELIVRRKAIEVGLPFERRVQAVRLS